MFEKTTAGRSRRIINFSSRVTRAVSEAKDEKGNVEAALGLILQTFYLISSRRKGPKGPVTYFSVNIGYKGKVNLIKLKATTTFESERVVIVIDLSGIRMGG